MKLNDTIAAIATPRGMGGIAIIRLSGENAPEIASKLAKPKGSKDVTKLDSHKLALCNIHSCDNPALIIDEALVSVMRAPKSYTGENVVEINCHGGFLAADKILTGLLKCGARLAEPGEFTRRAFINGKTDLSGAEAVMDLMNSSTETGLHNAAVTLNGALADKINALRASVMELAAHVSAAADYPEEVDPPSADELEDGFSALQNELSALLDSFETGRIMRDGVRTAIVGRPNVGKSSILNALLRWERAIVTDIPGTTRDTIEELVTVGGIALRLSDTAGIHSTEDTVESIGIERSRENLREADLCLFVIDSSEALTDDDIKISNILTDKKTILIINKADKEPQFSPEEAKDFLHLSPEAVIMTSAPKEQNPVGIDKLEDMISKLFTIGKVKSDGVYLANERQRDSLLRAGASLECAQNGLRAGMPYDLLYIDLEDALTALGEVTGETVSEEIIDRVFDKFCVGK